MTTAFTPPALVAPPAPADPTPRQAARLAGLSYFVLFGLAIFANFFVRGGRRRGSHRRQHRRVRRPVPPRPGQLPHDLPARCGGGLSPAHRLSRHQSRLVTTLGLADRAGRLRSPSGPAGRARSAGRTDLASPGVAGEAAGHRRSRLPGRYRSPRPARQLRRLRRAVHNHRRGAGGHRRALAGAVALPPRWRPLSLIDRHPTLGGPVAT